MALKDKESDPQITQRDTDFKTEIQQGFTVFFCLQICVSLGNLRITLLSVLFGMPEWYKITSGFTKLSRMRDKSCPNSELASHK